MTVSVDDNKLSIRTKIEELDMKNRKIKYIYPDGFFANNITSHMHAIPKGDQSGCIVNYGYEYENEANLPEAKLYIDYLLDLAKGIDAHLYSHA